MAFQPYEGEIPRPNPRVPRLVRHLKSIVTRLRAEDPAFETEAVAIGEVVGRIEQKQRELTRGSNDEAA